jgi:hypothetical protein
MQKSRVSDFAARATHASHAAELQLRRLLQGPPRVRLDAQGTYSATLQVEGTFQRGWVGSFAAGIAEHGVSIVQGHAQASSLGDWRAEFRLERRPTGALFPDVDFIGIADREVADFSAPRVQLAVGSAARVPDHDGSLFVIVEGRDEIGFLATCLTRLAQVGLYPVEIAVSTQTGMVADRLWLRGAGQSAPDDDALFAVFHALHPVTGAATSE